MFAAEGINLVDPVSGDIYMFSIMQDQCGAAEQGASGWAHTVGLARRIWLNDDGTDLFATGNVTIDSLYVASMGSIFD